MQNKQFDRHQKMKVWLAHGNNRTLQGLLSIKSKIKMRLHHDEKVYSVKLHESAPCWKSFLVKLRALYVVFGHQCYTGGFLKMDVVSGLELLPSFFFGLWKNFANDQEHVCLQGCFFMLFVEGMACFSCFFSNICQLVFIFFTVYCDKTFKHWQESSSLIRLQFSFIIIFLHK